MLHPQQHPQWLQWLREVCVCYCHMAAWVLFHIPGWSGSLMLSSGLDLFGNRSCSQCVLYQSRAGFPSIAGKIQVSLWSEKKEAQLWGAECPLPVLKSAVMVPSSCSWGCAQRVFSFQRGKGRKWEQAVFLIVFVQPSLVSEDRVQERGTVQSAPQLADACTCLPLWLIPNTSRSFRRVIFYFHFGALLLLLLCPLLPNLRCPVSCCLSDGSNVHAWFLSPCRYGFSFCSKGCFSCHFYSPVSSILHRLWLRQSVYIVFFRGVFVLNECLLGSPM